MSKKRGKYLTCLNCGKLSYRSPAHIARNHKAHYCSNQCQHDYTWKQRKEKVYKHGIESLNIKTSTRKDQILKQLIVEDFGRGKTGKACWNCGWEEVNPFLGKGKEAKKNRRQGNNIPTQLSHKDGDPINNDISNLEILCPNCHSLSEFHGSRGKGGRNK